MNTNIKHLLFAGAAVLMAVSCYKDGTDFISSEPRISIYPEVEQFAADGKTASGKESFVTTVIVNHGSQTTESAWNVNVSGTCNWATVTKKDVPYVYKNDKGEEFEVMQSGFELKVNPNAAYKRTVDVVVSLAEENFQETFTFTQLGALADAKVESDFAETGVIFMSTGGTEKVTYTSNMGNVYSYKVEYEGDSKDWITLKDNGVGDVDLTAAAWADKEKGRSAKLIITVGDDKTSKASVEIPVVQNAAYDFYYLYGSSAPAAPTADKALELTRKSADAYTLSFYVKNVTPTANQLILVKNARAVSYPCYALAADGSVVTLENAGASVPAGPAVDVNGLVTLTVNWKDMNYSLARQSTDNCLPDSEVPNYPTKDYATPDGGVKTWMTVSLHWNGGPNIGTMKLGTMVALKDDPNNGGFKTNAYNERNVPQTFDTEESGGKVKGQEEISAKYGRLYSWTEALMGEAQGGMNVSQNITAWPVPYCEGKEFIDAVGDKYVMPAGITALSGTDAEIEKATPTVAMQIQGICPYGWHISNLQDWKDLFYAALKACGKEASFTGYAMLTAGNADVAATIKGPDGWNLGTVVRNEYADAFGFNLYPLGRRLVKSGFENLNVNNETWICHPGDKGNVDVKTGETVYKVWRLAATTFNGTTKLNGTYDTGNASAPIRCVKNYK